MKKLILFQIILLIASCKKEEVNPALIKEFSIQSVLANATYSIKVGLPENYEPSKKNYKAIYVLDGDENFNFVTENTHEIGANYSASDVLVVGIGYGNNRTLDYTPTKTEDGEGGAEEFMQFISDELMPKIENDFGADTTRESKIVLGHSFGGLLAAYAFTDFNDVFGNYLMLSPSIWYDNEILLRYEQENRNLNRDRKQRVFMGIGELETSGRMLAPYMAFYERLHNNYTDIRITNNMESGLNHSGSKNPNIKKALNFYFQNR